MHVAIPYMISVFFILTTLFAMGSSLLTTYSTVTSGWTAQQARAELVRLTRITSPTGQTVDPGSQVLLTLVNEGKTTFSQFSEWDVFYEIQQGDGITLLRMTYTTDSNPAADEWTIQNIYINNLTPLADEIIDRGLFSPAEKMIVLANLSVTIAPGTFGRATFVTPEGEVVKVIFESPSYLYVVDGADATVYTYNSLGMYLGSNSLNGANGAPRGITTDESDFWTTDVDDDTSYEYSSGFVLTDLWGQSLLNTEGTGITTNGVNIWVADGSALRVFKYQMDGTPAVSLPSFLLDFNNTDPSGITVKDDYLWIVDDNDNEVYRYDQSDGSSVDSFPLDAENTDPTGITTDGFSVWVVDSADLLVYQYNTSMELVSTFALTGDNSDPQGIATIPR